MQGNVRGRSTFALSPQAGVAGLSTQVYCHPGVVPALQEHGAGGVFSALAWQRDGVQPCPAPGEAARMHFSRAGRQSRGCSWLQESHERTRLDNHEESDGGEQASSPTPLLLSWPLPSLVMHFEWMRAGFKLWLRLPGSAG